MLNYKIFSHLTVLQRELYSVLSLPPLSIGN